MTARPSQVSEAIREAMELLSGRRPGETVYLSLRAALPVAEAHEALADAATGVLAGFADGTWVRDISGDHRSDWAVKLMRPMASLAKFEAALARLRQSREGK